MLLSKLKVLWAKPINILAWWSFSFVQMHEGSHANTERLLSRDRFHCVLAKEDCTYAEPDTTLQHSHDDEHYFVSTRPWQTVLCDCSKMRAARLECSLCSWLCKWTNLRMISDFALLIYLVVRCLVHKVRWSDIVVLGIVVVDSCQCPYFQTTTSSVRASARKTQSNSTVHVCKSH